ncbi:MAG: hypothetical protein COT71_02560 [Candidatus Andersenbacteria bacterium CG10_big_fil_rev_8_21_14_0_10_54_11]|uniref:HTTM-like domain-containing protein n=1 Tax=Candidatus Andersenbacteria bacterium CG10_big_fil_rev_8_21_14_0_10_54_11 TaxID=1974485 RepID=A0A2M6WZ62_9BACT|nr:MAG: hypothetical protein COT71_02560 [Candidatus Andersenbacteria bacterium CG10_big_fil_rev_8_21_14_0_10_54_11]
MMQHNRLRALFGVDIRSLALLRAGIAAVVLLDLLERSRNLRAHYTDAGVLPRPDLWRLWPNPWLASLYSLSGSWQFVAFLFTIAAVFACLLLVGYRTRLAAVVTWLMLVSLHNRNPLVLQGGDGILRVTLFWAMFLPLGQIFSFDYLRGKSKPPSANTYVSLASCAYLLQMMLVYLFAALLKSYPAWHAEGSAAYFALHFDQLIRPAGAWLRTHAAWLKLLTHATWYTELIAPFVFFSPILTGPLRTFTILGLVGMQIGFNIFMRLGFFGIIAVTALLGALPSWFWDKMLPRVIPQKKAAAPAAIYYDNDCGLCQRFVDQLRRLLSLPLGTVIAPAADNPAMQLIMTQKNSWVVVAENRAYTGFAAFCRVLNASPWAWMFGRILAAPGLRALGEVIYRLAARSRHMVCVMPSPPHRLWQRMRETVSGCTVLIFLVLIILWNGTRLPVTTAPIAKPAQALVWATGLQQQWGMFAPAPSIEDGWYVIPGKLANSREVDLFRGGKEVTYEKPHWVAYTYQDKRWQKYMNNLWQDSYAGHRLPYARYLCRQWNAAHDKDERLKGLQIIFMLERTPPPGQPIPPIEPNVILNYNCEE